MRFLICVVVCLMALIGCLAYHSTPSVDYDVASHGRGIFGIRGRIQDRRAAGEGILQGNGPIRRGLIRGC